MWLELDTALFVAMGGGGNSPGLPVWVWLAQWSGWIMLPVLLHALWRHPRRIEQAALLLLAGLLAQQLAHQLAQLWATPRPFMLGLSPNLLAHGQRGGFPSAHASVMFALAASVGLNTGLRRHALLTAALAALTGWARICAGAHFPLDVLAGCVLGTTVAWLCAQGHTFVTRTPSMLHQRFG